MSSRWRQFDSEINWKLDFSFLTFANFAKKIRDSIIKFIGNNSNKLVINKIIAISIFQKIQQRCAFIIYF